MRVLELLYDLDVVELDIEVLVDALERPADLDVVLELHRHLMVDEGFEETVVAPEGAPGGRTAHVSCWSTHFFQAREHCPITISQGGSYRVVIVPDCRLIMELAIESLARRKALLSKPIRGFGPARKEWEGDRERA